MSLITPVLFVIFNRPDTTRQVFASIREAKPLRLYIAADGPREGRLGEAEMCEATRNVVSNVDWECEVFTLFSSKNLGLGKGLTTAIGWFFENETEGVILEDDCLPSPSFFTFCSELLERYRYDTRVMEIAGNNFERAGERDNEYSYRFSNHIYIWGWATWRRAWLLHDFHMLHYTEISNKGYLEAYDTVYEKDFYQYVFGKMFIGDDKTNSKTIWDYQWQFACKIHSGLVIIPNCNLIINLGFGSLATNTLNPKGVGYDLVLEDMKFPIRHPEYMMVDRKKDGKAFRTVCTSRSSRFKSRIKNILPKTFLDRVVSPLMHLFY